MIYCNSCGKELPAGASFCPKCGAKVQVPAPPTPPSPPRYEYRREEKEEKQEKGEKQEKEHEKQEKDERHEKGEDRLGAVTGGLVLVILGVTLYLAQIGAFNWRDWWAYLLLGIGAILIITAIIRILTSSRVGAAIGNLIGGLVLLAIGGAGILGIETYWPLIIFALGGAIIVSSLAAYRRNPRPT